MEVGRPLWVKGDLDWRTNQRGVEATVDGEGERGPVPADFTLGKYFCFYCTFDFLLGLTASEHFVLRERDGHFPGYVFSIGDMVNTLEHFDFQAIQIFDPYSSVIQFRHLLP